MKVKEIMHSQVITIDIGDNIKRALDVMNKNNINGAPVEDKDGNLAGVVVKADIYRFLIEQGHYDTYPIESIMTKDVITANKDDDVIEVANKLINNDIASIPIVEGNKVVGMVSIEAVVEYFIKLK
ncbi:CBS domain-containing protein [Clostridium ganghwense]|uniref:CBS domain-containing protein n=1 Tax=Clostridium ganghwense TaxID=312089 RepID=A0ABT4CSG4_9CLOT|nr:CBS domain-containing protein [Clostridium ganghwense]MCY6370919.1 CBS domain-containing protein [Clostridium ganghwense]